MEIIHYKLNNSLYFSCLDSLHIFYVEFDAPQNLPLTTTPPKESSQKSCQANFAADPGTPFLSCAR